MAKYRISQKAVADLDGIWKYTAETWSEEQADRYYVTLQSTIISSSTQNKLTVPSGLTVSFTRRWISKDSFLSLPGTK